MVLPSLCYETFGNVVVESFAAGRPAIVSDLGAIGEAVDHERTGLKVRPGDAAALGDAMLRILTDAGAADRMGHRARSHYVADFSPKRNLEMLMDAYRFATRSQEALACAI